MKILELFAGTGSVGKVAEEKGHSVYSIELDPKYNKPTWTGDILKWNYKQFKPHHFDMIWASPPCCSFSAILYMNKWTPEKLKEYQEKNGLPLVKKTLEIIDYFKPKYYCIENPYSSRMKEYIDLPFKKVCYCRYGFDYKKPTRLWTNINFDAKWCKPSDGCENSKKHKKSIAVSRVNPYKKEYKNKDKWLQNPNMIISYKKDNRKTTYRIPPQLVSDILDSCL